MILDQQRGLFNIMRSFCNRMHKRLERLHLIMMDQERRKKQQMLHRGKVADELENASKATNETFNALNTAAASIFSTFGQTLSNFATTDFPKVSVDTGIHTFIPTKADSSQNDAWDDDEARQFYESLPDLRRVIPPSLETALNARLVECGFKPSPTKDSKSSSNETTSDANGPVDADNELLDAMQIEFVDGGGDTDDADSGDGAKVDSASVTQVDSEELHAEPMVLEPSKQISHKLTVLLASLQTLMTPEMVDKLALEYCHLSNKSSEKRLVQHMLETKPHRIDVLPYYARFLATIRPLVPQVCSELCKALTIQFKSLARCTKKSRMNDPRRFNLLFISELAKFHVIPPLVALHCLRILVWDYSGINIQAACIMLESCGRFLSKVPATSTDLAQIIDNCYRKSRCLHRPTI